jgi:hypothetical protein
MDENVLRAILWLNETEAFLVVKPLYSTFIHKGSFHYVRVGAWHMYSGQGPNSSIFGGSF